jgi:membrane protein required for colicin V production
MNFLLQMNPFDAVVLLIGLVAFVLGFMSGLLRSLATILGYICAAPLSVAATPALARLLAIPPAQTWWIVAGLFIAGGVLFAALLRAAVSELTGEHIGIADRITGALLGAVRIFLIAVLMVLVFDRLIPVGREPAFLLGSKLRPYLTATAQLGLKSLPPDVADYIDRVKRERGL